MIRDTELVEWFRESTPYVSLHRDKTFVIMLDGDTIACKNFINIINVSVSEALRKQKVHTRVSFYNTSIIFIFYII